MIPCVLSRLRSSCSASALQLLSAGAGLGLSPAALAPTSSRQQCHPRTPTATPMGTASAVVCLSYSCAAGALPTSSWRGQAAAAVVPHTSGWLGAHRGGTSTTTTSSSSSSSLGQRRQQPHEGGALSSSSSHCLSPDAEGADSAGSSRHSSPTEGAATTSSSSNSSSSSTGRPWPHIHRGPLVGSSSSHPRLGVWQAGLSSSSSSSSSSRGYHSIGSEYKLESVMMWESCWRRFEEKHGQVGVLERKPAPDGREIRLPREVVWLNGAPGAGKGVNTRHILKTRGLTRTFTISGLLANSPEARRLMDAGDMIPDALVGDLLLEALLVDEPGVQDDLGFVVDGFPRTAVQVDFLKQLYDKMLALHAEYADTPAAINFPRPSFKVVILYIDEETSIKRQMQRARVANLHNQRVIDAGAGHFYLERATDADIEKCRKRYAIFKTHYAACLRLKQFFPFTLIDAMGTLQETREQITKELRYQSSLDLGAQTYALIRHLPLARDVVLSARQELVMRLDGYVEGDEALFMEVIDRITNDVLPVIRQSGLAGHAEYVSHAPFFLEHPIAVDMMVDVLTDRGFRVCYIREEVPLPAAVDWDSGNITCLTEPLHRFRIQFETKGVREDMKALEIAARMAESNAMQVARDVRISHSYVPHHLQHPADPLDEPDVDAELAEGEEGGAGVGGEGGGRVPGIMGS